MAVCCNLQRRKKLKKRVWDKEARRQSRRTNLKKRHHHSPFSPSMATMPADITTMKAKSSLEMLLTSKSSLPSF